MDEWEQLELEAWEERSFTKEGSDDWVYWTGAMEYYAEKNAKILLCLPVKSKHRTKSLN